MNVFTLYSTKRPKKCDCKVFETQRKNPVILHLTFSAPHQKKILQEKNNNCENDFKELEINLKFEDLKRI